MARSFVLMTAMPPTTGHLRLIQFANRLTPDGTIVLLNTQPHEPFPFERAYALREAVERLPKVTVQHIHKTIEQNPNAPGFWDMWQRTMQENGATKNDYIVASEPYGQKVATLIGARFLPYDIERSITPVKATPVRDDPLSHFNDIIPEFQKYLRTRITIFGAESTGKTTLSKMLAGSMNTVWLFEYARPYLENTVNEITDASMHAIWRGQKALQQHTDDLAGYPIIVQDTDLFSTVGYWSFPHWQPAIGTCPPELIDDATSNKSDLYIITKSNIPFEADPLRYGGGVREGSDEYWINLCKTYNLPYVVLNASDPKARLAKAKQLTLDMANKKLSQMSFDRHGL